MDLLNKLTIKNLKLNKKRTIVTIIGIILAVALITAVASMYSSFIYSCIKFETTEKGDFHVAYYNVNVGDISTFKNNRSIDVINITKDIGYSKINSSNEFKPYVFVKAFTKNSLENLSVKLVEGRLPLDSNEIVIPTHLKTNGRVTYEVGDEITLDIGRRVTSDGFELDQSNPYNPDDIVEDIDGEENVITDASNEEIVDTKTKTYKIVGIIERPANNIESYSAPGYTLITFLDNNSINGNVDLFCKYNKDGSKRAYEVTAGILDVNPDTFKLIEKNGLSEEETVKLEKELSKAKYNYTFNGYLIALENNPIKSSGVGGLGAVVVIVIVIIIFTSVFCIKNSFDISITEKIKQYGMLRSIGATKKQIKKNVFYEASILGLFGIPLGVLSGVFASFILVIVSNIFLKGMLADDLKLYYSFSILPIVIACLLGAITIYFSAFRSARRASLVSPIDSIRNSGDIKIKARKVKSPKIIKKLFGMGGDISYKNLKRNKKKYRTTVFSIIVSVSVFIGLTGFMSMAFATIDAEVETIDYDIYLLAHDWNDDDYNKIIDTVNLDNVDNYTFLRTNGFYFDNPKYPKEYLEWFNLKESDLSDGFISIYALGDEQYKKYVKELGLDYEEVKDKGILFDYMKVQKEKKKGSNKLISKTMRVYSYEVGDIIKGKTNTDIDGSIEIGYILDRDDTRPFGLSASNELNIVVSDEVFNKFSPSKMLDILYESSNADKLQDDIDDALTGINYSLTNVSENAKMMDNLFTLLGIFLYGFIIVISLIGITNIFNTITTNMELRKQEFAMLKSVGMTGHEFNRMIRLESLFMGVKSLFFGIPIGILITYIIFKALADNGELTFKLPWIGIIISIVAVFILISVIMRYSLGKINRQNTIETIRNENI